MLLKFREGLPICVTLSTYGSNEQTVITHKVDQLVTTLLNKAVILSHDFRL